MALCNCDWIVNGITSADGGKKMGYSCTRDAADMLGMIGEFFKTDGNRNILTIHDKTYFFERGRENGDGSITGTLMEMLPNDYCRKAGSVKIGPDGTLMRFPLLTPILRTELINGYRDMQARNPQLLRSWHCGL